MIDILRKKLAETLSEAAYKGLGRIDKDSVLAAELKKHDVEAILKADIEKICNNVTFLEMTRIMTLAVQLNAGEKRQRAMKADLKRIIQQLIDKVEAKAGVLQTPLSCRELFFNL